MRGVTYSIIDPRTKPFLIQQFKSRREAAADDLHSCADRRIVAHFDSFPVEACRVVNALAAGPAFGRGSALLGFALRSFLVLVTAACGCAAAAAIRHLEIRRCAALAVGTLFLASGASAQDYALNAPERAHIRESVTVGWTAPQASGGLLEIRPVAGGRAATYAYTLNNPQAVTAPEAPSDYEIVYVYDA